MPLYEYRCKLCRVVGVDVCPRIELRRSVEQRDDPVVCPCVDGMQAERVLSVPAIRGETVAKC